MRRMLLLMMGVMLSGAMFAGTMRIQMDDYSRYEIKIDGKRYTTSKNLVVDDLRQGRHSIKIYEVRKDQYWGDDSRTLLYDGDFRIDRRETLYLSYDDRRGVRINNNYNNGYNSNDDYYRAKRQREIAKQREYELRRQRDYDRRRYEQSRRRNRNVCEPQRRSRRSVPQSRRTSPQY